MTDLTMQCPADVDATEAEVEACEAPKRSVARSSGDQVPPSPSPTPTPSPGPKTPPKAE